MTIPVKEKSFDYVVDNEHVPTNEYFDSLRCNIPAPSTTYSALTVTTLTTLFNIHILNKTDYIELFRVRNTVDLYNLEEKMNDWGYTLSDYIEIVNDPDMTYIPHNDLIKTFVFRETYNNNNIICDAIKLQCHDKFINSNDVCENIVKILNQMISEFNYKIDFQKELLENHLEYKYHDISIKQAVDNALDEFNSYKYKVIKNTFDNHYVNNIYDNITDEDYRSALLNYARDNKDEIETFIENIDPDANEFTIDKLSELINDKDKDTLKNTLRQYNSNIVKQHVYDNITDEDYRSALLNYARDNKDEIETFIESIDPDATEFTIDKLSELINDKDKNDFKEYFSNYHISNIVKQHVYDNMTDEEYRSALLNYVRDRNNDKTTETFVKSIDPDANEFTIDKLSELINDKDKDTLEKSISDYNSDIIIKHVYDNMTDEEYRTAVLNCARYDDETETFIKSINPDANEFTIDKLSELINDKDKDTLRNTLTDYKADITNKYVYDQLTDEDYRSALLNCARDDDNILETFIKYIDPELYYEFTIDKLSELINDKDKDTLKNTLRRYNYIIIKQHIYDNMTDEEYRTALLNCARDDDIETFVKNIDPDANEFTIDKLSELINDKDKNTLKKSLSDYSLNIVKQHVYDNMTDEEYRTAVLNYARDEDEIETFVKSFNKDILYDKLSELINDKDKDTLKESLSDYNSDIVKQHIYDQLTDEDYRTLVLNCARDDDIETFVKSIDPNANEFTIDKLSELINDKDKNTLKKSLSDYNDYIVIMSINIDKETFIDNIIMNQALYAKYIHENNIQIDDNTFFERDYDNYKEITIPFIKQYLDENSDDIKDVYKILISSFKMLEFKRREYRKKNYDLIKRYSKELKLNISFELYSDNIIRLVSSDRIIITNMSRNMSYVLGGYLTMQNEFNDDIDKEFCKTFVLKLIKTDYYAEDLVNEYKQSHNIYTFKGRNYYVSKYVSNDKIYSRNVDILDYLKYINQKPIVYSEDIKLPTNYHFDKYNDIVKNNKYYVIDFVSVSMISGPPVLYLMSNVGNNLFMTNASKNLSKSGRIVMKLNNSFQAGSMLIYPNGEFTTIIKSNDLSNLEFRLVDCYGQIVRLLNPMYLTIHVDSIEDELPPDLTYVDLQNKFVKTSHGTTFRQLLPKGRDKPDDRPDDKPDEAQLISIMNQTMPLSDISQVTHYDVSLSPDLIISSTNLVRSINQSPDEQALIEQHVEQSNNENRLAQMLINYQKQLDDLANDLIPKGNFAMQNVKSNVNLQELFDTHESQLNDLRLTLKPADDLDDKPADDLDDKPADDLDDRPYEGTFDELFE